MARRKLLLACIAAAVLLVQSHVAPRSASPSSISVPVTRARGLHISNATSIVERNQHRVKQLFRRHDPRWDETDVKKRATTPVTVIAPQASLPATMNFQVPLSIGNPPTSYNVLVDTATATTWIGNHKAFVQSSTSVLIDSSPDLTINYLAGFFGFVGGLWRDMVSLGPEVLTTQLTIGVASNGGGDIMKQDGILAVGPSVLSIGTFQGDTTEEIESFADRLGLQISLAFQPVTTEGVSAGVLSFGDVDSTLFTGNLAMGPVSSTSPCSKFWGVDASISYGNTPLLTGAGIVDSLSTFILIRSDAFRSYLGLTGGTAFESVANAFAVTSAQFNSMQSLKFTINNVIYEFNNDAQIWPVVLNPVFAGGLPAATEKFLIVNDLGDDIPSGIDFILGAPFLERFFVTYQPSARQIGFANTQFTASHVNNEL